MHTKIRFKAPKLDGLDFDGQVARWQEILDSVPDNKHGHIVSSLAFGQWAEANKERLHSMLIDAIYRPDKPSSDDEHLQAMGCFGS